jgi:hypothetical protein
MCRDKRHVSRIAHATHCDCLSFRNLRYSSPDFSVKLTAPIDYLNVFKPTTRANWDFLTPLALLGLSLFGVAFIYSAVLQSPLYHNEWIKQLVYLGMGAVVFIIVYQIE